MRRLLGSLAFEALFYLGMAVFGLVFLPAAIVSPKGARSATQAFCVYGLWLLRVLCGVRIAVRGAIPQGSVIVAAKHQSFLDVLILNHVLPHPMFVIKRELLRLPIFGWYVSRMGVTAIDRSGGASAVAQVTKAGAGTLSTGGQFVIYPQGTRTAPGATERYKFGVAALYGGVGQDCIPAAVDTGAFWGRRKLLKSPGVATVTFAPTIPAGLEPREFLALLEARIETASAQLRLEAESGVTPDL